jgi:hypothetical protein
VTQAERGYRLQGAPIIHDTIDNETIAINQKTGAYYSLEGPAAVVWELLARGTNTRAIVETLAARFEVGRDELDQRVPAFLRELIDEGLAVEAEPDGANADGAVESAEARAAFRGLELHRYTDLEVLLLVDPIHEVDDSGWPKPRSAEEA